MAMTIKEFIAELSAIENQDQPIASNYWLAEDFEFADGETATPTPEQFGVIISRMSLDDISYEELNDSVYYFMSALNEEEEGE